MITEDLISSNYKTEESSYQTNDKWLIIIVLPRESQASQTDSFEGVLSVKVPGIAKSMHLHIFRFSDHIFLLGIDDSLTGFGDREGWGRIKSCPPPSFEGDRRGRTGGGQILQEGHHLHPRSCHSLRCE